MARLPDAQRGRVPVAPRALAARPLVLLRQGPRRQPDRADGPRLHVLRAAMAGAAWRLDVQAEDVPAVLRELARFGERDLLFDGLDFLLTELGLRPVGFEHLQDRLHHLRVLRQQADLAAAIELERAQALTADERLLAVSHHRAHVHPSGHFLHAQVGSALRGLADDADVDTRLAALTQQPQHLGIGDLRIPDDQAPLGALDERRQLLPRVLRTDD